MSTKANAVTTPTPSLFCSFCGKDSDSVKALIAGPSVFICDECVGLCNKHLGGEPVAVLSPDWTTYSEQDLLKLLPRSAAVAETAGNFLNGHVDALRARGVTWEAIGQALGVSRQAAWQRFS